MIIIESLYTGNQLLELKENKQKATRTQTGAQAVAAITKKYGSVIPSAQYYHAGKGSWIKYSLSADKKKTGKIAKSKETWATHPYKYDWEGIDTKSDKSAPQMPKFSISKLKKSVQLKPRSKLQPKQIKGTEIKANRLQKVTLAVKRGFNFRVGFKWKTNGRNYTIVAITGTGNNKNIKYINADHPNNKFVTTEKDLTYNLFMDKQTRETDKKIKLRNAEIDRQEAEHKKKQEAEYQKKLNGLDGFEATFNKLNRTKAVDVLNNLIKAENGKIYTKKEYIKRLVNEGWRVSTEEWVTSDKKINGERITKTKKGRVLGKDDTIKTIFNKTELDFAEYLIRKFNLTPKLSISKLKQKQPTGRKSKYLPKIQGKPKTKVVLKPLPTIEINHHYTKGKRNGTYAPTKYVKDPIQAFKVLNQKGNLREVGLLFSTGPYLVSANEISNTVRTSEPAELYNMLIKKLGIDEYYAYLKLTDDPTKLKKAPLRTLPLRENWMNGAIL